jgi:hypothetical protein
MRKLLFIILTLSATLYVKAQCNATATALGPTTFCQGSSVSLVAGAGDTYQWLESGAPVSGATNDTLVVNAAGSYSVVIDSAGCIDTSAAIVVTVNTVPAQPGPISGPGTACINSTQTFSVAAVPGATGYWWKGIGIYDTLLVPTITGPVPQPINHEYDNIMVSAVNNCGSSQFTGTILHVVGPPPGSTYTGGNPDVADLRGRVCPGNQYRLYIILHGAPAVPTDNYTLQWCLDNVPIPGATNWEHIITRGGNYSVKVTTDHCGTLSIPKKVFQDVPNSISISPTGPLSFCTGNATPLTVSFDFDRRK